MKIFLTLTSFLILIISGGYFLYQNYPTIFTAVMAIICSNAFLWYVGVE